MPCIFCDIVAGRAPSERVWEDDRFVAFLDIQPIRPGHLLIIPRAHVSSIYDLPDADYADLFRRARDLEGALRRVAGSGRVGLAVEGFGVDHAHLHLVPVDRVNDLDPCLKKEATREALRELGDRLRAAIGRTARSPARRD